MGVNTDGTVIVGAGQDAAFVWRAFRWTPAGGFASLGTVSGATETYATDVSGDGTVVCGYS